MSAERLEEIRTVVDKWRGIVRDRPWDYEHSIFPAAIQLLDAVDAALTIADRLSTSTQVEDREIAEELTDTINEALDTPVLSTTQKGN